MEFRILGPLEVTGSRGGLDLGGTRQQVILATLLLGANRVVTIDRLVEAVYGERSPSTARAQVQIAISALRRLLASEWPADAGQVIETHPQGYVIRVSAGQLDAQRFSDLVAAAREAKDEAQAARAVARYRDALRLWRGSALVGIDSDLVRLAASHLDEQRIAANEDRITLELDLGRHHELVVELAELIEAHPLRERLREQHMLALYRCDRVADALQAYQDARRLLVDELGIEPNERLRKLERAILVADPALLASGTRDTVTSVPARPAAPRLLPADIADFAGRAKQVQEAAQHLLAAAADKSRLAVPVVALSGRDGIGKSSIAVHTAHSVAAQFPDGQLFADLHGASAPVPPVKILDRFLRALGMLGAQIPETIEERAEAYRDLMAGRKVLVLLDDAASEAQVAPLLPGTPGAAVIVTSRGKLAGLPGAAHITVDVLDADKSVELLARIVGSGRVGQEPDAAVRLAQLCGHLPLALRIAGARLSSCPHWKVKHLVDRLADEARRLDELRYGDMAIRTSISLTYDGLDNQARRLVRRLAILDAAGFSQWAPVALLEDMSAYDALDLLDRLVSAQLVRARTTGHPGQYRFHDLIRLFARERLAAEEPAARRKAALQRFLTALLCLAEEAHRRHYGGDYVRITRPAATSPLPPWLVGQLVADPLEWYESERAVLLSAVRQAANAGLAELCWRLAVTAVTLQEVRFYLDDWRETHEIALEAARKASDLRGEACVRYSIGTLCLVDQRYGQARQNLTDAARLFEELGDEHDVALVIRHIGFLDQVSGDLNGAARHYERALALLRAGDDPVAVAYVLQGLAQVRLERAEIQAAQELLAQALRLSREARSERVEAQVQHRMGEAHLLAGEHALAGDAFGGALAKFHGLGDLLGEAYACYGTGVVRTREGAYEAAHLALDRALRLAQALGDHLVEARALLGLCELALAEADVPAAITAGEQAAGIFRSAGMPRYEAQARAMAGRARAAAGQGRGR